MKGDKILQRLFLISLVGTGFWCLSSNNSQADVVTQPTSDMTDITSGFTKKIQIIQGDQSFDVPYTDFKANYVRNGRITKKTNQVSVTVNGNISLSNNYSLGFYWLELYNTKTIGLNGSLGGLNGSIDGSTISLNETKTFTPNSKYLTAGDTIWFGAKLRTVDNTYYQVKEYEGKVDQITLKPTITSNLDSTSTTITGTGTQVGDTITVKEGSTSKTTTVGSDGKWSLDWGKKFTGKATVTATESDDYGDNSGSATTTVGVKRDILVLLDNGSSYSVAPGKTVNIEGIVTSGDSDSDQTDLKNSDFTVHTTLDDGEKIDDFKLNGTKDDNSTSGYFNLDLAASKLKSGTNKVSFYVTDNYGNQSPTVTATVNLKGSVQLSTVSNSLTFASTEVPTTETLVKPSGTWDIEVDDNLVSGQTWSLYATASALTSGTHTLKGNTVYVDDTGSKHVMTDQSTLVSSGTSTGTEKTTNVAKNWSSSQGIFLDVQPGVYAGKYTGTVDWSLQNTPQS